MKVSLVLEALDKMSRPLRAMLKVVEGANNAASKGASEVAAATGKTAKAYDATAKAATAAGDAAAAASATAVKGADETAAATEKAAKAYQTMEDWERRWGKRQLSEKRQKKQAAQEAAMAAQKAEAIVQHEEAAWARRNTRMAAIVNRLGSNAGGGLHQAGQGARGIAAGAKSAIIRGAGVMTGAGALGAVPALMSSQIIAPSRRMEEYENALRGLKLSAAEARQELAEVAGYKLNFSIEKSSQAFVKMRDTGIKPTEAAMRTLGDAAAANSVSIANAADAVASAIMGRGAALNQFGIRAAKTKKYMEYSFVGDDGRMKKMRALLNNKASQEKALMKIFDLKFGGSMSRQAATWEGMLIDMSRMWEQFRLTIANAGVFDFMKDKLGEIRKAFEDMEKSGQLKELAQNISDNLIVGMKVGWEVLQGVGSAIMIAAQALAYLNENVMSFKTMGYILLAMPFVKPLLTMTLGFINLGIGAARVVKSLAGIFAVLKYFGVLPGIGSMFLMLLKPLSLIGSILRLLIAPIGLVVRAFVGLGVAMMTTPIGWVIAGIAAIAGAAYLIYSNWDAIGPYFSALWDSVKSACSAAWEGIKTAVSTAWDGIKALFGWTPLGLLINNWDTVTGFFTSWGSKVLKAVKDAWQAVEDWLGGAVKKISDTFSKISDGVRAAWAYVFSGGDTQKTLADGLTSDPAQLAAVEAATANIRTNIEAIAGADTSAALDKVGGLSGDAAKAAETIGRLTGAASAAVQAVKSMLAGVSLQSHGTAMMATLAAGIRAGAGQAVAAVRETTQAMRDFLPHSPAKVGPLSDLHHVRFSETLAGAIRPGPAVAAVQRVAAGMAAALPLSMATPAMAAPQLPVIAPASPQAQHLPAPLSAGLPAGPGSGSGGTNVQITYSPNVTMQGSGPDAELQIRKLLRENADEIARLVDEAMRRRERLQY